MKKSLKYIKIKGVMTSRGEYRTASDAYRPYEAVTIIDEDGSSVHFYSLLISKRMDEDIILNEPCTFYILRYRSGDTMSGAVFAIDSKGKKIYYPDTSISAVKALATQASTRKMLLTSGLGSIGIFLTVATLGAAFIIPINLYYITFLFSIIGIGVFLCHPVLFPSKYIDLPQLKSILIEDGFDVEGSTNSKY